MAIPLAKESRVVTAILIEDRPVVVWDDEWADSQHCDWDQAGWEDADPDGGEPWNDNWDDWDDWGDWVDKY